ncbi:hypothetical protein C4901_02530 [Acidiferrobacter sp. SPIII_3]|uniref:transposase n=1 Tax=Acidiferrobacter sp. SPIII_3 TaxID=1281578 RepID=UPI000D72BE16|nr:hypothetical protein C4901_02530 [Acidiferrobacter sp. SPIII_3]
MRAFHGDTDPGHRLRALTPKVLPSAFVNNRKTVTSRLLGKEFADHLKRYYWSKPVFWSRSYCILTETVTSRLLGKEFADHLKRYYWSKPVFWSRSYCILTVGGAPLSVLKQYMGHAAHNVEQQERPECRPMGECATHCRPNGRHCRPNGRPCRPNGRSPPPEPPRGYRRSTAALSGSLGGLSGPCTIRA